MNVGFVGLGPVAGSLVAALVQAGALAPEEVWVYARPPAARDRIPASLAGAQMAYSAAELARRAGAVFLGGSPAEAAGALAEVGSSLTADNLLVLLDNTFTLAEAEARTEARAAKVIPSVAHAVRRGVSLLVFGERCTPQDRTGLLRLMGAVSRPYVVPEEAVRAAADLTACGPAFLGLVQQALADAARARAPALSREDAIALVRETALATCELMAQTGYDFADVVHRVAASGGPAAAGLDALQPRLTGLWEAVLAATDGWEAAQRARLQP